MLNLEHDPYLQRKVSLFAHRSKVPSGLTRKNTAFVQH
jgi:hypothetical protein